METYTFNKETKKIKLQKDCEKCSHIRMCLFHSNMKELATSNTMYKMTSYLENNNILRIFELHSACKHYTPKYIHIKGNSPDLNSDPDIIRHIIHTDVEDIQTNLLQTKYKNIIDTQFFFWSPDVEIGIENDTYHLTLKTTNKEIGHGTIIFDETIKISDILTEWKFE